VYRQLTSSDLPEEMPTKEWRKVDGILELGIDKRVVEIDESQHFNRYRGDTLLLYPKELRLAFDRRIWIARSKAPPRQNSGNWARPKPPLFPDVGGRHLQRAFRDALADILPLDYGFQPTLRIADFEVKSWIGTASAHKQMEDLLHRKMSE
jgi:hypothetical protein